MRLQAEMVRRPSHSIRALSQTRRRTLSPGPLPGYIAQLQGPLTLNPVPLRLITYTDLHESMAYTRVYTHSHIFYMKNSNRFEFF